MPTRRRESASRATRSHAWTGFQSVLCPVDFSEHSKLALRYAEAIARRSRATLTIPYVNDPLLIAAAAAALHDRQLAKKSASELTRFIDETLTTQARNDLTVKSRVSVGQPVDEILKAAARGKSDLIVLGTQGLTGADRILMGSTTLSILRQTSKPVLAVPRSENSPSAVPDSWPGDRIVAALELDPAARAEAEIAARIARWFGSSLLLVHVVPKIAAPAWVAGDLSASDQIRVAQAERKIEALAAAVRTHIRVDTRVVSGRPAHEIAALAAAERAGLVMTALRDRQGWLGSRRGSVSYHLVSHAATPVLAYPPRWRPR